jgi:spore maturation protein CgeB
VKIVICGLSITSSWGNGHATTYRALARALHDRGHEIVFFERDLEWYSSNRDLPQPPFCRLHLYENWSDVVSLARREFDSCDVAVVGSFFPDGIAAIDELLDSSAGVKAFYDIDTPITVAKLSEGDAEYLRRDQVPAFDLYFSFSGGLLLEDLKRVFRARRAVPLYCSFDPGRYRLSEPEARFQCELSYMGTYASDRQPKLDRLLCAPAAKLPQKTFLVAGPQYPPELVWPPNVRRIIHLEPKFHPPFYCSSKFTLNVTREDMVAAGWSPSVRLFEAAGCGAAIISDSWAGLDSFFVPGKEILVAKTEDDVIRYLQDLTQEDARRIGRRAQKRVLAEHSSEIRASQFEESVVESRQIAQKEKPGRSLAFAE